ncbi:hypothetical protein PINS_up014253 [Pythium insidiosum]|nr:hypothetical protein PINS_up014253 [Pythium insidiosum]
MTQQRDDPNERATKRVRFATSFVSANDATHLAIGMHYCLSLALSCCFALTPVIVVDWIAVHDADQVAEGSDGPAFFSPAFTYHAFGKSEEIEGYEGLRIEILFNARDFSAFLKISHKSENPNGCVKM